MSGSGLLTCKLTRNPISLITNPCCNHIPIGVVPALRKAMRRRDFIKAVAGSATSWPLTARAQQTERVGRIGVLNLLAETDPQAQRWDTAFRKGLDELGLIDGR